MPLTHNTYYLGYSARAIFHAAIRSHHRLQHVLFMAEPYTLCEGPTQPAQCLPSLSSQACATLPELLAASQQQLQQHIRNHPVPAAELWIVQL